jgi:hypothetical protein
VTVAHVELGRTAARPSGALGAAALAASAALAAAAPAEPRPFARSSAFSGTFKHG